MTTKSDEGPLVDDSNPTESDHAAGAESDGGEFVRLRQSFDSNSVVLSRQIHISQQLLADVEAVEQEFRDCHLDLRNARLRVQDAETLCRGNSQVHDDADASCMTAVSLESRLARRLGVCKQRHDQEKQITPVKLTAIQTPKFDGRITEYMRFKARFVETIQSRCSPEIALMKLRDEALTSGSSEHLLVSGTRSIQEAFRELDDAFLDSEILQSALLAQIRDLKPAQNYYDSDALRKMISALTSVMRDLEVLECSSALDMSIFSSLMVKIPPRLRDDIDRQIAMSKSKVKNRQLTVLQKIDCFLVEAKLRCRLIDTHTQRTKAYAPNSPSSATGKYQDGRLRDAPAGSFLQDPGNSSGMHQTCLFHPDAKRHPTHRCNKLKSLSAMEIRVTLERNKYCLCCLVPRGPAHQCNVVCPEINCSNPRSHSKLLHSAFVASGSRVAPNVKIVDVQENAHSATSEQGQTYEELDEDPPSDAESVDSNTSFLITSGLVLDSQPSLNLSTADYIGRHTLRPTHVAYVRSKSGSLLEVSVLYDGGSDLSEVTTSVAEQTDMKPVGVISDFRINVAASTVPTEIGRCSLHNLELLDATGKKIAVVNVVAVPWIGKLRSVDTREALQEFHAGGISTDSVLPPASGPIHVLLGSNCPQLFPLRVHTSRSVEIGLTKFGPILYGSHPTFTSRTECDQIAHSQLLSSPMQDVPDGLLSIECPAVALMKPPDKEVVDKFLSLEADPLPCAKCGHSPVSHDSDSQRRFQIYQECIRYCPDEQKVFTTFPWRSDLSAVPDNRTSALQRLRRLTTAAVKDPDLTEAYVAEMDRMIDSGILVEVTDGDDQAWKARGGRVWYVGHFPVKNPSSTSTPVRPVFDPSIPFKGITLSRLWEQPPNLIPQIVDMYIGFRDMPVAVCLDFKKAYWTLWLDEVESHMHRIVYNRLDSQAPIKTYRITRNSWGMVPAGALCSIAMLMVAEKFKDEYPRVYDFVRSQLYVDDGVSSCETVSEALKLARDTNWVMSHGGFVLKHFIIGGQSVDCSLESLPEDIPDVVRLGRAQERVLGAIWEPVLDVISFAVRVNFSRKKHGVCVEPDLDVSEFEHRFPRKLTLRMYLSVISTLFDPLGLVCPVTISLRHEFGRLLLLGLSWDDEIPSGPPEGPSYERCRTLIRCLLDINTLTFPRCVRPICVTEDRNPILVGFSDASQLAFSACVYACFATGDGSRVSRLVLAKSKPLPKRAPLLTIPRAELEACKMLSELVARVVSSSRYVFHQTILLTDSTICLGQILASPYRLKQWPATRVQAILERTSPGSWYHVRSEKNVADIATRGVDAKYLEMNSVWQCGSSFMALPVEQWPIVPAKDCSSKLGDNRESDEQMEVRVRDPRMHISREPAVYGQALEDNSSIMYNLGDLSSEAITSLVDYLVDLPFTPPEAGDSWTRLRRRVARAAAFVMELNVRLAKREKIQGFPEMSRHDQRKWIEAHDEFSPSPELMQIARTVWCRKAQKGWTQSQINEMAKLNPKQDQIGLWRALGRIHTTATAPILLPGTHALSEVILTFYHQRHHSSADSTLALAREHFWIRRGQVLANRIVSSCVTCRRVRKKPTILEMGPLPDFRWQRYPVFSAIFLDLCGPFFCTTDRRNTRANPVLSGQVWVLVVICAVSHAVHIELVESYNTENFLSALDTFISLRGTPAKIFCDQGSQLVAGGEVTTVLRNHVCESTEWHFAPSGAHQFVGAAEALVKAVKSCMEVLYIPKYTSLTKLQFSRILYSIANLINDRPLAVGRSRVSKLDDMRLIRPNDLLMGRSTPDSLPPMDEEAIVTLSTKQQKFVELIRLRDACLNQFWLRFYNIMFQNILPRPKWLKTGREFSVGDTVLVRDNNPVRGVWTWGQIDRILPSQDGRVREAIVRYKDTLMSRGKKNKLTGISSKYVRKSVRDLALLLESEI